MTGTEAQPTGIGTSVWRKRVSMVLFAAMLMGGIVAIRTWFGPQDTAAQAPVRRTVAPRTTQARTTQPRATQTTKQTAGPAKNARTTANAPPTLQTIQTMAMVNGKPINREELGQACLVRFGESVLESLVNKHLIWQECRNKGIQITEQDVEQEISRVAAKFGIPVDQWIDLLREKRDITPAQYRQEMIWPQLALRRLAANQIVVTEEDLKKAMETEYGAKVSCRMIAVKDKSRAAQLQALAAQNPDKFGELAKEHSEDTNSASARGLIQPIRRHVGDKKLEQVAFSLKPGQVSSVVPVAGQHVILKCEKILPESFVPAQNLPKVKERLADMIRDGKMRGAAEKLFARLEQEARVVNVYNNPQLRAQQPGVAAMINNRPIAIKQLSDECLERHGLEVLEGEINRTLLTQELQRRNIQVTQAAIDAEVARAADSFGYLKDGQPDIQGWLKKVTETEGVSPKIYIADAVWPSVALKQLVRSKVSVTQEDLQEGYEANYGPRVEAQAIVFNNARQAQQVWAQAKANNTEKAFGELAYQYSIEPVSRANYGRVPPISRHSGHEPLEEEAYRLKAGELSSIIATGDKYIILRCLGRTTPVEVTFDEVKDELTRDITERKLRVEMAKEFDRLHDTARIENYLAQISPAKPAAKQAARPTGPTPPVR